MFIFIQTLCTLLDCLLTPENVPCESPREIYETYFTFACIWAFGGALYQDQVFINLRHVIYITVTVNIVWLPEL